VGLFDFGIAIQLFNDMTIEDMNKSLRQVYSCLKPGGCFVFSVPHPNQHHGSDNYFSLRDMQVEDRTRMMMNDGKSDHYRYA
jgi:SAM-dependent methyltransferase